MSTAKQEIGNTFKSLALRTVFRSQAKSPHKPGIACDRVHRGIALYPLRAKQQSERYVPSHLRTGSRRRLYLLGQLSNSRSGNLRVKEGKGGGRIGEESKTNAITPRAPKRQLWGLDWMTERLVITEVGMSAGNEKTCSMPGIIMDRLHPGKKRPPFVCWKLHRVGIKEPILKHTEGNVIFGNTELQFSINFKALLILVEERKTDFLLP